MPEVKFYDEETMSRLQLPLGGNKIRQDGTGEWKTQTRFGAFVTYQSC